MMKRFQLGRATILDGEAPEYMWLKKMLTDRVPRTDILRSVMRCLGGNELLADAMVKVAEGGMSRGEFAALVEQYQAGITAQPQVFPKRGAELSCF
ncbi:MULTISPECIES: hypothetical protein [Vibrio]|uniref:Uncharacterized protein n=1 Tax=Vibrio ostreae TaxID=2841925 RepID=A0A975UAQ6_9VIBR|nr:MULTISPECIES: hypothetical protein [Vibrio]QXO18354.1 hypothetical protein KNV97_08775 [Vibrio ostreae]